MKIEVDFLYSDFNYSYIPAFVSKERELIIYGGAGAGKSYFAVQKILDFLLSFENRKVFVARKTFPALKITSVELIEHLFSKYKIPYKINKSDWILQTINRNRIIFRSLDDVEKIKSLTDVDMIWVEEATELKEGEIEMVNLRLRGERLKEGEYRQMILTFNPISKEHWLYDRYFKEDRGAKFKFTYKDNLFIDDDYKRELEDLKYKDENFYKVYCLGEWGVLKNKVFDNYEVVDVEKDLSWYDEIIGGIDWGYNNPSVFLLIGIKDQNVYIIREIYKRRLLNSEFLEMVINLLKEMDVKDIEVYADPSEPDRIEEFESSGFPFIMRRAVKEVVAGINFLKARKIYIDKSCVNTKKEFDNYKWKENKDGQVLDEPVKFMDHSIDALRYAVYTNLKGEEEANIRWL